MTDVSTYSQRTGIEIRDIRLARRMSLRQIDIASDRQFKECTVGAWERGTRPIPVEKLAAYARWLGLPVTQLLPPEKPADEAVA